MTSKLKIFYPLLFLILIGCLPLVSLTRVGLPITHDGQDHVARIANFYQSLSEGNVVPRWAGNLNWGYGHPILMFLYPLPSYIASFFHFVGFSFVDSTKIVFCLSFILSGIFMYLWIKEMWGEKAGFLSAIFYMFAPYRFVDLYVRGAIGENLAFAWLPLSCFFALKLSQETRKKYLIGLSLSLAALILSHNALSLMFLPVIFGYIIYLFAQLKNKRAIGSFFGIAVIFGFIISAFYWLPALVEGKYTLRDIVTRGNITGFENFFRLVWSPWSFGGSGSLSVQVGVLHWLAIVAAVFIIRRFYKEKKPIYKFLSFLFVVYWTSIFLMLPASKPLYMWIPMLQKFQFVWRFLSLAIFPPAVFAGAFVFLMKKNHQLFFLYLIIALSMLLNRNYWHARDFIQKEKEFFIGPYAGTTDTGESSPRWSVRFMENFPASPIEVIEGSAKIDIVSRKATRHVYRVVADKDSLLVENTLYFPGWQVLINEKPVPVEFQNPQYRGLMTFVVPVGTNTVKVIFGETKLRLFADVISLLGLGFLLTAAIIKNKCPRFL